MLLDEGFPSPGFDPTALDPLPEVQALREFDPAVVGERIPDWYLYLRALEAGFHALVTHDFRQSGQADEMWTLTRTDISVVTWRKPLDDPIVEWGQVMAYLPEIRRVIFQLGPAIVFLPRPQLSKDSLTKATDALAALAKEERRSRREVVHAAEQSVRAWLDRYGQLERFEAVIERQR